LGPTGATGPGVAAVYVPASSTSTGVVGNVAYDSNFVYICVAPDTWRRAFVSTF